MTLLQVTLHGHSSTFRTPIFSTGKLPFSSYSLSSACALSLCGRPGHLQQSRRYAAQGQKGGEEAEEQSKEMGVEVLQEFIDLNIGSWTGFFTQFDALGNALQCIPTRLSANSYGRGEQVSLYQTLHIKQAPPKTVITGEEKVELETEWAEYKLEETNILTIERMQHVGYFPSKRAYTASHQTAEMLDRVIRAGVLGEDDDELEECIPDVKLPSQRPALVCESCLYANDEDTRMRAFHVLDPRGLLDFIGIFQESKRKGPNMTSSYIGVEGSLQNGAENRLDALLGCWKGHSVKRRTGMYGSTLVEEDVTVTFKLKDDGTLLQDIKGPAGSLLLKGLSFGSLIKFDKGLQMTLLPGGMAMASPVNVRRPVGDPQAFYFEFSWIVSTGKRLRLVRTYDTNGAVVSTTFVEEIKL